MPGCTFPLHDHENYFSTYGAGEVMKRITMYEKRKKLRRFS
jgi:hypothetical protein